MDLKVQIRETIIALYKKTGSVPTIQQLPDELGMSAEEIQSALRQSLTLSTLMGLSPNQAIELLESYGAGTMFDDDIEKVLAAYKLTRSELDKFDST